MDEYLKKLVDAPLANAGKINLPQGKLPVQRATKPRREPVEGELSRSQVQERRAKLHQQKQDMLLAYYAGTGLPPEKVAEHVGLYRTVEVGTDPETGKPITEKVLDVEGCAARLNYLRGPAK